VISANRNFEGRIHPQVRAGYLASPALVVAYAIAGTVLIDLTREPLGGDIEGHPVYLRDIWPTDADIREVSAAHVHERQFTRRYGSAPEGASDWSTLSSQSGATFAWNPASEMLKRPPFFEAQWLRLRNPGSIGGARILALLGDSITTDHIAPMGAIPAGVPAAAYLSAAGVSEREFGSYLLRRSNHEVMIRGALANIRLRNRICPEREGGFTRHFPSNALLTIYEAAQLYLRAGTPLVVVAGKEYGSGSSRDWAAKGVAALGISAVIAESFERIHRSNLVGMGVLPLEFPPGVTSASLGLNGSESLDLTLPGGRVVPRCVILCRVSRSAGTSETLELRCRIDTEREAAWYQSGGILNYVLGQLQSGSG
jgi:aconitate hydratase